MSRRRLLKVMGLGAAAATLAACQPKVVEKEVTKEVE
ncbi:MAG: twin-arginine translocation signal domain-containing protein, partial [Anaerolineales bacterium]